VPGIYSPNYVRLLNKQNVSFRAELKQVLPANFHVAVVRAKENSIGPAQQGGQSFHIFV